MDRLKNIDGKLRRAFSAVCKPLLASSLLGFAAAGYAHGTHDPIQDDGPDHTEHAADISAPAPDGVIINGAYFNNARANATALMAGVSTGYSDALQALEDRLNKYLRDNNLPLHDRVIVIDPIKTSVGKALHLSNTEIVRLQVGEEVSKLVDLEDRASLLDGLMTHTETSPSGIHFHIHNPLVLDNDRNDGDAPCILVAANEFESPFDIPGLSVAEARDFFNHHEGWHCLDTEYRREVPDESKTADIDLQKPRTLMNTPYKRQIISTIHKKETLADVAALGDMIRAGARYGILRDAAQWREETSAHDFPHYSTPVLAALDRHIRRIGLETFRRMDDMEARSLYYHLTDTHGLSAQRLDIARRMAYGRPDERRNLMRAAVSDPDMQTALAYAQRLPQSAVQPRAVRLARATQALADSLLSAPYDETLGERVRGSGLPEQMKETAFRLDGKITPHSMIRAYGEMQRAHWAEMHAAPTQEEKTFTLEKMRMLQAYLTRNLSRFDYTGANAARGVILEPPRRPAAPAVKPPTTS